MDEFGPGDLIAAGRWVRKLLARLTPTRAEELGDELDELLAAAHPDIAALAAVLDKDMAVRRSVEQYLFQMFQPSEEGHGHGLMPTGHSSAVSMPRWRCPAPSCLFVWYQLEYGEPIASCPTHGPGLVPA